jgi:hypothetical protein
MIRVKKFSTLLRLKNQVTDAIVVPQTMQILEHLRFGFGIASFPFAGRSRHYCSTFTPHAEAFLQWPPYLETC